VTPITKEPDAVGSKRYLLIEILSIYHLSTLVPVVSSKRTEALVLIEYHFFHSEVIKVLLQSSSSCAFISIHAQYYHVSLFLPGFDCITKIVQNNLASFSNPPYQSVVDDAHIPYQYLDWTGHMVVGEVG
jgi:hypothetical protein